MFSSTAPIVSPNPNILFFLFFFFLLFRATPAAYGCSQARGLIRAAAAGLHHSHSNVGSFYPLSEARDRTPILMEIRFVSAELQQELVPKHALSCWWFPRLKTSLTCSSSPALGRQVSKLGVTLPQSLGVNSRTKVCSVCGIFMIE